MDAQSPSISENSSRTACPAADRRVLTLPPADREPSRFAAWPGTKALTFCSPPLRADMLRTVTVRDPGAVSRCARGRPALVFQFEDRPHIR